MADTAAISESDRVMPVVPMFHVNAWGMPFVAMMLGATQVLPGPMMTPQVIAEMMDEYKVTISAGGSTRWLGLLKILEKGTYDTSSLRSIIYGGSASRKNMMPALDTDDNIPFMHAYHMTETTHFPTLARLKSYQTDLP